MATTSDYFKLHLLVFLWGFTAILGKLVTIPAVEMVFYRTLLAAIGMGVVIMLFRGSFKVSQSDLIKMLLTGAIVAAHWLTFFISGRISNPSTSLVGFATCSLWAAFIEPMAKKNKIQGVEDKRLSLHEGEQFLIADYFKFVCRINTCAERHYYALRKFVARL